MLLPGHRLTGPSPLLRRQPRRGGGRPYVSGISDIRPQLAPGLLLPVSDRVASGCPATARNEDGLAHGSWLMIPISCTRDGAPVSLLRVFAPLGVFVSDDASSGTRAGPWMVPVGPGQHDAGVGSDGGDDGDGEAVVAVGVAEAVRVGCCRCRRSSRRSERLVDRRPGQGAGHGRATGLDIACRRDWGRRRFLLVSLLSVCAGTSGAGCGIAVRGRSCGTSGGARVPPGGGADRWSARGKDREACSSAKRRRCVRAQARWGMRAQARWGMSA